MDDATDPCPGSSSSSATHMTPPGTSPAAAPAPMPAAAPHHTHPPQPRRRSPLLLLLLLVFTTTILASIAAGAAAPTQTTPQQQRTPPEVVGFVRPPAAAAAARPWQAASTGSTPRAGRGGCTVVWARKEQEPSGGLPPQGADSEEDEEIMTIIGGGKGKGKGGKKGPRNKAKITKANEPRPPVFTARIVLLGAPSPEWAAGVRDRLLKEGWMPDRVQALPLPDPREYREAKWIAYMREGIKLRNATFVIAGGPLPPNNSDDAAAPAPAASIAAAQVLRFLEKHSLRGGILIAPPDQYSLAGSAEPSRAWDYGAIKKHCPFVGLVYPRPARPAGEEDDGGWNPPREAEAVREGLGLAPYPFGIRGPEPGQEHKAIEALIRDWQFLESLGMGPIQLVGEDEEEEQEAALAKARLEKDD